MRRMSQEYLHTKNVASIKDPRIINDCLKDFIKTMQK